MLGMVKYDRLVENGVASVTETEPYRQQHEPDMSLATDHRPVKGPVALLYSFAL